MISWLLRGHLIFPLFWEDSTFLFVLAHLGGALLHFLGGLAEKTVVLLAVCSSPGFEVTVIPSESVSWFHLGTFFCSCSSLRDFLLVSSELDLAPIWFPPGVAGFFSKGFAVGQKPVKHPITLCFFCCQSDRAWQFLERSGNK